VSPWRWFVSLPASLLLHAAGLILVFMLVPAGTLPPALLLDLTEGVRVSEDVDALRLAAATPAGPSPKSRMPDPVPSYPLEVGATPEGSAREFLTAPPPTSEPVAPSAPPGNSEGAAAPAVSPDPPAPPSRPGPSMPSLSESPPPASPSHAAVLIPAPVPPMVPHGERRQPSGPPAEGSPEKAHVSDFAQRNALGPTPASTSEPVPSAVPRDLQRPAASAISTAPADPSPDAVPHSKGRSTTGPSAAGGSNTPGREADSVGSKAEASGLGPGPGAVPWAVMEKKTIGSEHSSEGGRAAPGPPGKLGQGTGARSEMESRTTEPPGRRSLGEETPSPRGPGESGGQERGQGLALAVPGTTPGEAGSEYGPYLSRLRQRIQESLRYPPAARRRGLSGTVQIEVRIQPDGAIGGVLVLHSSSHRILDEAALDSVRSLPPLPFPADLKPRTLRVRVPVVFELR
jgi:TonB family protein